MNSIDESEIIRTFNKDKYKKSFFECSKEECLNLTHHICGIYNLITKDTEKAIAIVTTKSEIYTCRICPAIVSVLEFSKHDKGYKVSSIVPAAFHTGSYGVINPQECIMFQGTEKEDDEESFSNEESCENKSVEVLEIGDNIFGLVIKNNIIMNGGFQGSIINIYSRIGNSYKNIFQGTDEYDNTEASEMYGDKLEKYKGVISFIKRGSTFYDLKVSYDGIKDAKKSSWTEYYKFNGSLYESDTLIK